MANTIFAESGTDATQDTKFWITSGTVTSATDEVHTGSRSLKLASSNSSVKVSQNNIFADTGRRISFYFRMDALPSDSIKSLFGIYGSSECGGFTINTNGTISIYNSSYSIEATGSTVLAVNTWYRFVLTYFITSASVRTYTVYINGTQEVTSSNWSGNTGSSDFYTQHDSTGTQNCWYSDIYVDDGSSGDPGDIRVTAKRPYSNGTTNGFTTQIGSGGSGYGSGHAPQVNEQPLSTTNGWSMIGAGSAITEEYTIEAANAGDVDISSVTIVGACAWIYAKSLSSESASMIALGNYETIALTSTNTLFTKGLTTTSYPGGGTDIGLLTTTALTTVSLYEAGILIAYIPSSAVNASVSQSAASLTLTGGTQSVSTVNIVAISQSHATLTLTGGSQGIQDIQDSQIAQAGANLTLSGGTQTVATINDVSISQTHATLTLTGGTQAVITSAVVNGTVTQVGASLTLSGGTQSIATVNDVSITQVAANVTASGGTQSVATQSFVAISQSAATLSLAGGSQYIIAITVVSASITQTYAILTLSGGTQNIAAIDVSVIYGPLTTLGTNRTVNAIPAPSTKTNFTSSGNTTKL